MMNIFIFCCFLSADARRISHWQKFKDLYLECCNPIIELNQNHDSKLASPESIDSYHSSCEDTMRAKGRSKLSSKVFWPYILSKENALTKASLQTLEWVCYDHERSFN